MFWHPWVEIPNKAPCILLRKLLLEQKFDHEFFIAFTLAKISQLITCVLFTELDVFVNSAGILVGGATESLALEEFDRCWNINTRSGTYLTIYLL